MINTTSQVFKKILEIKHMIAILSVFSFLAIKGVGELNFILTLVATAFLGIAVMTSVHHAEIIAHKIGEGLGTLVLALCVTIIEVGLILSLIGKDNPDSSVLARDTVFSAVMIVTNGVVALCLILGGLKFKEQEFQVHGSKSLLVVLMALSFIVFYLPNYTTSTAGPTYNTFQMYFIAGISVLLYLLFIFFQTTSHKGYFEPTVENHGAEDKHHEFETSKVDAWLSFLSLVLSLLAVIAFAKILSPTIEKGIVYLGAPRATVGLLIATIVLLPETWAAVSSARANRLQTSLNLALGSGIASIALTIPVVIIYSIMTNNALTLGLDPKNTAFLIMTFFVAIVTLGTGKSTLLQGAVHAVILLTYFVLSFIP